MKFSLLSIAIVIAASCLQSSLAATATAAAPDQQLRRAVAANTARRSLDWASELWNQITGGGDGDGNFGDGWDGIDWENIDWEGIASNLDDVDWDSINWGDDGAWGEWLENWSTGVPDDFSVCSVVETAMGMSGQFAEEANCGCVGDIESGLEIDCSFRGCAFESTDDETCGDVRLSFNFGGQNDGRIDVSACADMEDELLAEICFGYGIDVSNGIQFDPASHTCDASYGGQSCDCAISDSFCVSIDCSDIFPLLKTDTCQLLSLHDDDDEGIGANAFLPEFAAFRTTGEDNENNNNGDNDNDNGDAVEFELKGKTKTCGWVRGKLDELVLTGNADGGNKKKAKKKAKKFCKKMVNDKTDRIGMVCKQACKDAKEALLA